MIWAAARVPGDINNIVPVSKMLRGELNKEVTLIASGTAIDILAGRNEKFTVVNSAEDFVRDHEYPEVFITGMGMGDTCRRFVPFLRDRCPIIILQDYWGNGIFTDWADPMYRPDYICVNDETDQDWVLRAWPEFSPSRIIITGYPDYDQYTQLDIPGVSMEVRNKLGLDGEKPIVLFLGERQETAHALKEVVAGLRDLDGQTYFVPRFHPCMKDDVPGEMEACEEALTDFRGGILVRDSSACTTTELIASASLVLSMCSSTLAAASILRKPNISVLYPDHGMRIFLQYTSGIMDESPFVATGCSVKAESREQLRGLLKDRSWIQRQRSSQEKTFRLDGKNTSRVVNVIQQTLLPGRP